MASKNVKLNIKIQSSAGFKSVVASNGTTYYYKYTGGNAKDNSNDQNNGNNTFDVKDPPEEVEFTITFQGTPPNTYKFQTSAFKNKDCAADLSGTNTDTTVTVTDKCEHAGTWEYGAKVKVISGGATFDCDPEIKNR